MQKRIYILLVISILFQFQANAKKHHRQIKHHKVSTFVPIEVNTEGEVWGVDVSHHQSDIDWDTLNNQKPHFVFLKATEGITNKDNKYDWNYKEARDKNIPVGSYHFFTYKNSGHDQANNFLSTVKFNTGDLPPVLDLEFAKKMPPAFLVKAELMDFIKTIAEKLACYPIIYCNNRFFDIYLKGCLPEKCKLWIVDYKAKPNGNWTFWQTSNKHKLPGIKGYVDLNIFNGTKNNLATLLN
jgi:lysozyme